ncbi:uncharacterized protein VTP21DRAFT_7662 [Calcarisporiella thermophila]|uniref:uncharacterized protein n=1 Tax=Calcarisporiella thermophila TaxID=911321 RepID=UPI00374396AD
MSFRLSFWIGLADTLYRSFYILGAAFDFLDVVLPNHIWLCRIIFWSYTFFPMWFSLLTVSIACDLQLSAFHKHINIARFQKWYLPLSTIIPFGLSTPQLFYGNAWWNVTRKYISTDWSHNFEVAMLVLFNLVVFSGILYSFIVIFICTIMTTWLSTRANLNHAA